jgi:hypothetical protein
MTAPGVALHWNLLKFQTNVPCHIYLIAETCAIRKGQGREILVAGKNTMKPSRSSAVLLHEEMGTGNL